MTITPTERQANILYGVIHRFITTVNEMFEDAGGAEIISEETLLGTIELLSHAESKIIKELIRRGNTEDRIISKILARHK